MDTSASWQDNFNERFRDYVLNRISSPARVVAGGDSDDILTADGDGDGDGNGARVEGGAGDDRIEGTFGSDLIFGGSGCDVIRSGDGGDRVAGEAGDDFIAGGAGADMLYGDDGDDTLAGGAASDSIHGGAGNDRIAGDDDNDLLYGEEGIDVLYGGNGHDFLFGDEGDDWLCGGRGNDMLYGGVGNDLLSGGAGSDTYVFWQGDGSDHIAARTSQSGAVLPERDLVRFSDLAADELTSVFLASGDDGERHLVVRYGESDRVNIYVDAVGGGLSVDAFMFSDDTMLTVSQLQELYDGENGGLSRRSAELMQFHLDAAAAAADIAPCDLNDGMVAMPLLVPGQQLEHPCQRSVPEHT